MKVRDVIKLVEADGWYLIEIRGSHRQDKHPVKKGKVTIPGHAGKDIDPKTLIQRHTTVFSSKHK